MLQIWRLVLMQPPAALVNELTLIPLLQASEDSVPEDSDVQQVWSSARARRLLSMIRQQGMRSRGLDLRLLLGDTKDLYQR